MDLDNVIRDANKHDFYRQADRYASFQIDYVARWDNDHFVREYPDRREDIK